MKKKYLNLYYEWLKSGELPRLGLCSSLPQEAEDMLRLLLPEDPMTTYWGHELCANYPNTEVTEDNSYKIRFEFTPLRQNILLFICAMNGEL